MVPCNGEALAPGEVLAQVEQILKSDSFQRYESPRRLLSYLTDKSLSGEADQLKEYSIGVDVFGKGKDYDTRVDSGVRIQVGRLRQKLIEYYATDGVNDEIVVALPKGHFKLSFERRLPGSAAHRDPLAAPVSGEIIVKSREVRWRRRELVLAGALVAAIVWAGISRVELRRVNQHADPRWNGAMEIFWSPFVQGNRPLVVAVGTPLFIGLRGCCFYRDLINNSWEDAVQAPNLKALKKALNNADLFEGRPYTGVGQAKSMLLIGTLLGPRIPKILFARSSDLSWQQLSDSNALFVGTSTTFGQLLDALPGKTEMILENTGVRVLHPGQGEPAFFPDTIISDDGELHALISVLPGPNGKGFVGSLSASNAVRSGASGLAGSLGAGSLAAVEYATDPASVEELIGRLKDKHGRVPTYFQVALSVRFKAGVPTGSRYLLSREVRLDQTVGAQR